MNTRDAERLARRLMDDHGLTEWKFDYDQAKQRFGACHHYQMKITLSQTLVELNDEAEVRNTILHEIAHALAGPKEWHSPKWKQIARSIGCTGDRCYGDHVITPQAPFRGSCKACGFTADRHRRNRRACCPVCYKASKKLLPLSWRRVAI